MSIEPRKFSQPQTVRRFGSEWTELRYVCDKIRYWWFVRNNKSAAKRFQKRLEQLLNSLPRRNVAILAAEGRVLLYLLKGQQLREIEARRREIHLIELHQVDLQKSIDSGKMSRKMAVAILGDYDRTGLQKRQAMLARLQNRTS